MTVDFRAVVAANPKRTGLFLDFDGTISRIVEIPSDARPVEGAREVLSELARKLAVVSIVSGRSAGDLLEWLGPEIEIWGVHGAEHVVDGRVELSDFVAPYAGIMAEVRAELEKRCAELDIPGVLVEDKASIVGLHYRNAPSPRRPREARGARDRCRSRTWAEDASRSDGDRSEAPGRLFEGGRSSTPSRRARCSGSSVPG